MPKLKFFPHCTEYPPQYWCYPPTVLMLSPRMYWCYPPMYWIPSTVLKLSPTVLMWSPHCTEQPPQYWSYPHMYCCYRPTVLKVPLHSTEYPPQYCVIPHSTDVIPRMYWCYPPTVLNNLHSTEAIPPQYWSYPPTILMLSPWCTEQPPMYWTTSTVLNRRYMGWLYGNCTTFWHSKNCILRPVYKPGLHKVVTVAYPPKTISKLSKHLLQVFLVEDQFLWWLLLYGDQVISGRLRCLLSRENLNSTFSASYI